MQIIAVSPLQNLPTSRVCLKIATEKHKECSPRTLKQLGDRACSFSLLISHLTLCTPPLSTPHPAVPCRACCYRGHCGAPAPTAGASAARGPDGCRSWTPPRALGATPAKTRTRRTGEMDGFLGVVWKGVCRSVWDGVGGAMGGYVSTQGKSAIGMGVRNRNAPLLDDIRPLATTINLIQSQSCSLC